MVKDYSTIYDRPIVYFIAARCGLSHIGQWHSANQTTLESHYRGICKADDHQYRNSKQIYRSILPWYWSGNGLVMIRHRKYPSLRQSEPIWDRLQTNNNKETAALNDSLRPSLYTNFLHSIFQWLLYRLRCLFNSTMRRNWTFQPASIKQMSNNPTERRPSPRLTSRHKDRHNTSFIHCDPNPDKVYKSQQSDFSLMKSQNFL